MAVRDAAITDDRLATLVALRDSLASAIDGCESNRDLASLARQLTLVLAEIDELAPASEVDAVDEIAARRGRRRSKPAPSSARAQGSL